MCIRDRRHSVKEPPQPHPQSPAGSQFVIIVKLLPRTWIRPHERSNRCHALPLIEFIIDKEDVQQQLRRQQVEEVHDALFSKTRGGAVVLVVWYQVVALAPRGLVVTTGDCVIGDACVTRSRVIILK